MFSDPIENVQKSYKGGLEIVSQNVSSLPACSVLDSSAWSVFEYIDQVGINAILIRSG